MAEDKVIWCQSTTEAFPFSKGGGLGDYIYTFSKELQRRGHQVLIFSPYYEKHMLPMAHKQTYQVEQRTISFRNEIIQYECLTCEYEGMTFIFFRYPPFWGHDRIFRENCPIYNENIDGSTLLAKAMLLELKRRAQDIPPNQRLILQGNDIYSSFFAPLLRSDDFPGWRITKLYCIHNLAGDSIGPIYRMDKYYLDSEFKERINSFLPKNQTWFDAFIPFFDQFMTVSENYMVEITEGDESRNRMLKQKYTEGRARGFLNGIDNEFWSIYKSPFIQISEEELLIDVKRRYKAQICEKTGFSPKEPLLIFVGRITGQKGIQRLNAMMKLEPNLHIIILGQGEPLESFIEEKYNKRIYHFNQYSEELCHQLFAAADYSIVPSEYEPCGYVAMYAPRFGAIPLVRRTGGLRSIAEKIEGRIAVQIQFDGPEEFIKQYRSLVSMRTHHNQELIGTLAEMEWKWEEVIGEIERFVIEPFASII